MAGVSRLQYTTEIRLIRVMCSGRVDLEFILRALSKGADGVFVGGCRLNECNYITHGNYDAFSNVQICKKIMEHIGLNPERLRIEFMSSGEGMLLVDVINDFCKRVEEIGPLGKSDRAFAFGLLAVLLAIGLTPSAWTDLYLAGLLVMSALTVWNRARKVVAEAAP